MMTIWFMTVWLKNHGINHLPKRRRPRRGDNSGGREPTTVHSHKRNALPPCYTQKCSPASWNHQVPPLASLPDCADTKAVSYLGRVTDVSTDNIGFAICFFLEPSELLFD
jgi:hypothetical protein